MTSTSPPDIQSHPLSPQRPQQRPNENYETYDGRTPYFQTSPPMIPGSQNIFNTTQITPKSKSARAALPSVSLSYLVSSFHLLADQVV